MASQSQGGGGGGNGASGSVDDVQRDDEWVLVCGFVALTVQFVRLAMDMVQVASRRATSAEQTTKQPGAATAAAASASASSSHHGHGHHGHGRGGQSYGSTTAPATTATAATAKDPSKSTATPTSQTTAAATTTTTKTTEQRPLLSVPDGNGEEQDGGDGPASDSFSSLRTRTFCFGACWIGLAALFASISILLLLPQQPHAQQQAQQGPPPPPTSFGMFLRQIRVSLQLFPTPLFAVTALTFLLQAWQHYRDVQRDRYGCIQRFLQLATNLVLWIVYAVLEYRELSSSSSSGKVMNGWHIVVLAGMTTAVFVSLADGYIQTPKRRLHIQQRRHSKIASHPTVFLKLLKPYFWPDATPGDNGAAMLNRIRAIATWACVLSSKTCGLLSPLFLGWATTSLAHGDYRRTVLYACGYSAIAFAGTTFKEGQSLVYLKVAQAAFVQLSEVAFGHLHSLSLDWHLRKKLGEVLRSMDRGIAACDTLMKYLFLWLLPAIIECLVVCIIFATYFDYLPLALTIFYFVFVYIIWTILVTLWRKKFRKALVQSDNEYHDIFTDSMVNFETVKHFTAEGFEKQRFADAVSRYQAGSVNVQASLSFLNISQQIILQLCLASALSLAAIGIRKRGDCCTSEPFNCDSVVSDCCRDVSHADCPGMQVGDFVAVLSYTLNLFAPLNFLGSVYNAIVMAIVDLTSMSELLAEEPDVVDAPCAKDLPPTNITNPDIAVEFDNVFFHYPTQPSSNGLKGLSFKMKRGTTTAIVGPTGAGKTTVSRLLFRFYDVLSGSVKVNGIDVRALKQQSLRGAIGVVPQAASMFNDTIRYNLKYGRRECTQEEIEQAAKDAQILDFINSLDEGWETMVGDRGLKLSGGEKQRAAIARCLLKNPPFVLLDEATSALDTITEKSVQEALDRLGKDRTVLVIAHRLGTIRNADNIIVLKDGKVAEQGTHDELLKKNGVYADMWNMQLHQSASSTSLNM